MPLPPKFARWAPTLSAVLLLLAFPPFNLRFLVFGALIPWFAVYPLANRREAWRAGCRFGLPYMTVHLFFIFQLTARWTGSFALGLVPWLGAGLLGTVYFGLISLAFNALVRSGRLWAIPLIWAALEVVRSYFPVLAFPWGLVAVPLAPYPVLIASAHWVTVYGVGLWVVAFNLLVARRWVESKLNRSVIGLCGVGVLATVACYLAPLPASHQIHVLVGQPGVDLAFGDPVLAQIEVSKRAREIVDAGQSMDLTVLPEGIIHLGLAMPPQPSFIGPNSGPVLFGAQRGDVPAFQSAFLYDGGWHVEDKTRLVIFGEFVPGRSWLPLGSFNLPAGDLQAGDKVRALPARNLLVGPIVCFEELFPDISYRQKFNGAQLLACLSNDDWFIGTPALEQLRDSATFRAVETGLPLVRAVTNGYTLALDGKGRCIASTGLRNYATLPVTLSVPNR